MKLKYLYKKDWMPGALKVAVIVGTILFAINHGKAVFEDEMNTGRWISVVLSYIVPYCVYIVGKASNLKAEAKKQS